MRQKITYLHFEDLNERKTVKEETGFTHPEQAVTFLHKVLVQGKMNDLFERQKSNSLTKVYTINY